MTITIHFFGETLGTKVGVWIWRNGHRNIINII